eukprot:SAG31_NODE_1881_length_7000_cov_9.045646_4_plen_235_part_00
MLQVGEWPESTAELWGVRLGVVGHCWTVAAAELIDLGSQIQYSCSMIGASQRREDGPPDLHGAKPAVISRQVAFGNKSPLDQPSVSSRPELSPWSQWQEHEAKKREDAMLKAQLEKKQAVSLRAVNQLNVMKTRAQANIETEKRQKAVAQEAQRLAEIARAEQQRRLAEEEAQRQAQIIAQEQADRAREHEEQLALQHAAEVGQRKARAENNFELYLQERDGHSAEMAAKISQV